MSNYLLIPGAGGDSWQWHLVVDELRRRGHDAVAVDLPAADPSAGLVEYAAATVEANSDREDIVVVAQSLGGFVAPLVMQELSPQSIIFVNAMIPNPNETAADWGSNTDSNSARLKAAEQHGYSSDFDDQTYFFHDLSPKLIAESASRPQNQTEKAFGDPCSFESWDVPVYAIAGADDRLFPLEFQQRIAHERLGVEVEVVPGGHSVALSHPAELTAQILSHSV